MNVQDAEPAVSPKFLARYQELVKHIDDFCRVHLNEEYQEICRRMASDCCQEGSPVLSARAISWAAGIIWCAGKINFLSDPASEPCMTQAELSKRIGVSPATISAKARIIWDGLDLVQLDPDYTVSSRQASNPLSWIVEVNGLVVDLRMEPREVQEIAFANGLIPFIPDDESSENATI